MTLINKVCILALVAYVQAFPKMEHSAEGSAGYDWNKFLGKVPAYFKGPESLNELETSNQAGSAAGANSEIQHDEIAKEGESGSNYAPSNPLEGPWRDQFRKCIESSYAQSSSNAGSSSSATGGGSSSQYGPEQISGLANSESFNKYVEKCRSEVTASMGNYPGNNLDSQNFFSSFKPQMPSGLGSYTGAFTGSSPHSGSSASA